MVNGLKRKPTMIKNPQVNAILEQVHGAMGSILRTSDMDMTDSVHPDDVDGFVSNVS